MRVGVVLRIKEGHGEIVPSSIFQFPYIVLTQHVKLGLYLLSLILPKVF
jgi:hypothetical protein